MFTLLDKPEHLPWHEPAAVLAVSLALGQWWRKPAALEAFTNLQITTLRILYSMAVSAIAFCWCAAHLSKPELVLFLAILSLAQAALGRYWKDGWIAVASQGLLAGSLLIFFTADPITAAPMKWHSIALSAILLITARIARAYIPSFFSEMADGRETAKTFSRIYASLALLVSIVWCFRSVPRADWPWMFTAAGGAVLAFAYRKRSLAATCASLAYFAAAMLGLTALQTGPDALAWTNSASILAWLAACRILRKNEPLLPVPPVATRLFFAVSLAFLWIHVSDATRHHFGSGWLTVTWGALALVVFSAGLLWRDRDCRWGGLAILALALGRIVLFDMWKFDTVFRIAGFMALGVVLLVLGYLYNRYSEKIKQWL